MLRTIRKSVAAILAVSIMLTVAAGCKKNSASTPDLTGTWRNLDTSNVSLKYLVLRSDRTAYTLGMLVNNFHLKVGVPYLLESDKITIALGGGNATIYSYTLSHDTLSMTSPGSTIRFKKDADQNPDTWVKDINIAATSSTGNGFWFGPMDYAGSDYLISGVYVKKLYNIYGSNTQQIDSTAAMPGTVPAVVSIGGDIWISTTNLDNSLRKIDFATSTVTTVSTPAPEKVISMARHGNKILALTVAGTFYDYDPVADNFTPLVTLPALSSNGGLPLGYLDIEYKDNKVYLLLYNYLLEMDLASGQFTQTYSIKSASSGLGLDGSCFGLCYDGTSFVTEKVTQGPSAYDIHIDLAKFNIP
ncbi:MAG: hypothetical protein JSS76_00365 [Bacteroidetes bacterium]|nr:hypothetical protein [Bacteroidota bacterium]